MDKEKTIREFLKVDEIDVEKITGEPIYPQPGMMATSMKLGEALELDLTKAYSQLDVETDGYKITTLCDDGVERSTWITKKEYDKYCSPKGAQAIYLSALETAKRKLCESDKLYDQKFDEYLKERTESEKVVTGQLMDTLRVKPGSIVRIRTENFYQTGILTNITYQNGRILLHYYPICMLDTLYMVDIKEITELGRIDPKEVRRGHV